MTLPAEKSGDFPPPQPQLLWQVQTLQQKLQCCQPPLVLDVRPSHQLAQGAIPQAVHLDIFGLGIPPAPSQRWDSLMEQLRSLFSRRGVDDQRAVCVYEHQCSGMLAARAFWLLEYLGHQHVHLLDGGFKSWQQAGFPTVAATSAPQASQFIAEIQPHLLIGTDQVAECLHQPHITLLDVRSYEEFIGKDPRENPRAGAIPGALHLEWKQTFAPSGHLLPFSQLQQLFQQLQVQLRQRIITYCQGGYRSAHTYFVLRLLGWDNVQNYADSWHGWSRNPKLPIMSHG